MKKARIALKNLRCNAIEESHEESVAICFQHLIQRLNSSFIFRFSNQIQDIISQDSRQTMNMDLSKHGIKISNPKGKDSGHPPTGHAEMLLKLLLMGILALIIGTALVIELVLRTSEAHLSLPRALPHQLTASLSLL